MQNHVIHSAKMLCSPDQFFCHKVTDLPNLTFHSLVSSIKLFWEEFKCVFLKHDRWDSWLSAVSALKGSDRILLSFIETSLSLHPDEVWKTPLEMLEHCRKFYE